MRRAWAVAIKELRQIRRDRRSLLILVFIPALFLPRGNKAQPVASSNEPPAVTEEEPEPVREGH